MMDFGLFIFVGYTRHLDMLRHDTRLRDLFIYRLLNFVSTTHTT
jgi:hypothetical protein